MTTTTDKHPVEPVAGATVHGPAWTPQAERVLTREALELIVRLHREFEPERQRLLQARVRRQQDWDSGKLPGYLPGDEAAEARQSDWKLPRLPEDLMRRRVEITGPVNNAKMVINMLSRNEDGSMADAAMLDFEDSMKPSWGNVLQGVENVIGAARGDLTFVKPAQGGTPEKVYRLDLDDMPLLMVRCRGLYLDEANLQVDGKPVSGGIVDLALCALHTAKTLISQGKTPKYYVPKVEHYLEARWWDRLFTRLEEELGLDTGTLKATLLIETLPAAFQIEEILYEIRRHAAGLNVGRWDKIFSDIKVLKEHDDRVMADRASISLNRPWMKNYALRLIRICHRRGAFAMGGMAAFTPGSTPELREEQTRKVVQDKQLEFSMGHDGCWVSHPYFIGPAMSAFTRENQLEVIPAIEERPDLLPQPGTPRTMSGVRTNVRVGIGYTKGWNEDIGCVAWDNLMEDLATLEISRAQIWQWLRHNIKLDDGTAITRELIHKVFDEELAKILEEVREAYSRAPEAVLEREINLFKKAKEDAERIFLEKEFRPFYAKSSELWQSSR